MELDDLKTTWNTITTPAKTPAELRLMLQENQHPVLKGIRKQIIIEVAGWLAFLLCYYTMFDGADKPVFINVILVASVLATLVHNLMGYSFSRYLVGKGSIKQSLEYYFSKVKLYAALSVASRLVFITGLLAFFSYNISFDTRRYMVLGFGLVILGIQLVVLGRIWIKRLKILRDTLNSFN